jgi:hypothetical protein
VSTIGGWQLAAGAVFAGLTCLVIALMFPKAVEFAGTTGVRGAREGLRFLIAYWVAAAVLAGLAAVVPRRLLWVSPALGALGLGATLLAVATSGGEWWSLAVTVLTLTGSLWLARAALRLPGLRRSDLRGCGLALLAAGFGLLGLAVFLLGIAGLIRWWTVGLLVVVAGLAGLVQLARREPRSPVRAASLLSTRFRAGALALLGLQGAYALIWSAAPEIQYDALQHKAWLPALWAHTGEIEGQTFTDNPRSVYLGLAQLVATPGHTLEAPAVGRFLQLATAVLIVVVLWRLGSRLTPNLGPIAALAVALTPHVAWQASTAYDDLFLTALVLGGAAAVLHFEGLPVTRPLAASAVIGFLCGTCITGKLHLAPFALALAAMWCLIAERGGDLLQRGAGLLIGGLAGALPLLVYRWVTMDNPVFPYFNHIFESRYFRSDVGITTFDVESDSARATGSFFWDLVASFPRGIEQPAPFGLLLPFVLVAVLFGWRGSAPRRAVWGAMVLSLLLWWTMFRYLRFALPYSILAVFVALPTLAGVGRLVRGRLASAVALTASLIAAGVFIVSVAVSLWNVPERFPYDAATGRLADEQYLQAALNDWTAVNFLNEHAGRGEGIIGQVWSRLLLRLDLQLKWEEDLEGDVARLAAETREPDRLRAELGRRGFRWVVLADDGRQYRADYFLAPLLQQHGQIVFADRLRDVYEIVEQPRARTPVALCDETFRERDCWFGAVPLDDRPGLTDAELRGGPIGQSIPACPGATYALTVTAGEGVDPTRIFFLFDVPAPEQAYRSADVPPGGTSVVYQTAPADARRLDLTVDTLGPTARLERMSLAIADTSLRGRRCP